MSTANQRTSSLQETADGTGPNNRESAEGIEITPFRELVEEHPDGLLILGAESVILYANPASCRLLNRPAELVLNRSFKGLIHPGDLLEFTASLERLTAQPAESLRCILRCRRGDTDWEWLECVGRYLPLDSQWGFVMVLRDLGSRREQLERLTHLAFTDPVTGLANRTLLMQRLTHRLKLRDLHRNPIGILSLDLDGFKRVNDTFGHAAGDELLLQFGRRLTQLVRECDTVARIGGDEFVVMLEEVSQISDVAHCAERLVAALSTPIQADGREVRISASIGATLGTSPETNAEELLECADVALYRAKAAGKARFALFDEPAREEVRESTTLQLELREALQNDQLCLHYQPEIDLKTGRISGIEALLRWKHPQRGLIEAAELLPLVQQAALDRVVRRWVFLEVCRQVQRWSAFGTDELPLQITINLSEEDLHCEELGAELEWSLRHTGIAAHHLVLECPEAILIEHTGLAMHRMHSWRKLGFGLALDSFGAEFGSLRLLECLPIQVIKVDPSLVDDLTGCRPIFAAICSISHDLQVTVIAKCIETLEQYGAAVRADCGRGQGYLFCPPLNAEDMTELLQSGAPLPLPKLPRNRPE